MALSYANILDRIEQTLQDTGNNIYDTTELGMWIEDELKRISRFVPLFVDVIFQIESRSGTDVTGTASKLTDTSKAQFLAADATNEKVVHNTTDDKWAVVTARDSASVLSLSRDIMGSGDSYEIYNKRCRNKRQIYIGDMPSEYLNRVVSVEYPLGTERNFTVLGEVIELDIEDGAIQDSNSTLANLGRVDVLVRFAVPQILSQLTDLAGEVDLVAGYAEGLSTIHIDGMGAAEVIEIGEQFTLENQRSTYIITVSTTLASNEGDITFYPPLEAALVDNEDITFRKSTLTPNLEDILTQRVAARASISKGAKLFQQLHLAINTLTNADTAILDMRARINQAITDVKSGRTEVDRMPSLVSISAAAAIAKIDAQIVRALTELDLGRTKIDTVNVGGGNVPGEYRGYAVGAMENARARLTQAQAHMAEANADERTAETYALLATRELTEATQLLSQAGGYLREVGSRIQLASASRIQQDWGERILAETEEVLRSMAISLPAKELPRS